MQEKLISGFDTNELAGTIASIQIKPQAEPAAPLPPIQPGTRKTSTGRRSSRDEPTDKIDIDSENIETPPVTRRAYGARPFSSSPSGGAATSVASAAPLPVPEASAPSASKAAEDDDLGDGRFDRYASIRRTRRRVRNAPEGAEEECSNLEPRKSPEGVEDPVESDHRKGKTNHGGDVIVGMEVKKVRRLFEIFYSAIVTSFFASAGRGGEHGGSDPADERREGLAGQAAGRQGRPFGPLERKTWARKGG